MSDVNNQNVEPQGSTESGSSVVRPLFDKHNDNLCWLISKIAYLDVTQKPLENNEYEKAIDMLSELRKDLFKTKA
jgi:hypothetical protein